MESQHIDLEIEAERAASTLTDYEVFESLYPALRRFAAVVAMDLDPDDLLQDALVATLQHRSLAELERPQAYLKRAIVNRAHNRRRGASRLQKLLPRLRDDATTTDHYPSDLAVLAELDPIDRAIVFLADVEGLPHDVIAEQLAMSPAATRKRASRARTQLRALLTDEGIRI